MVERNRHGRGDLHERFAGGPPLRALPPADGGSDTPIGDAALLPGTLAAGEARYATTNQVLDLNGRSDRI